MAVSAEQIEHVSDLFADLGQITTRKMMGGLTIYADGQVFAILDSNGRLYLKATGPLADDLAAHGQSIFSFEKDGKTGTMGYWTLPDAAIDDADLACHWGRKALAALR